MTCITRLAVILAGAAMCSLTPLDFTRAQVSHPQTATRDVPAAVLRLAQAKAPQPPGLPPAPTYIPGTAITPEAQARTAVPAASRKSRQDRSGRISQGALQATAAGEAEMVSPADDAALSTDFPPALAAAAAPAVGTDSRIWGKLLPLLPAPGDFAIVPGSELRPHLVRDGEFPFCDDIKCYRSGGVLAAWNGGAFDAVKGEFRLHGGGHADYGGNEVYAFDFSTLSWTRETDPQPLTGGFLRDTDGDGEGDICPAPASGPPATHTYQGFIYVPKIDRYWLLGTAEYCADGMGGRSAWEYDAHSGTWVAMPQLDQYSNQARAVVDAATGNVILHGGRKDQWHEIEPASREIVTSFTQDPFGSYTDGATVFDPLHRVVYAIIAGGTKDRLVAYRWPDPSSAAEGGALSARLVVEWPKAGRKSWGMAQHASGLLVLWDGNERIVTVDPQTGQSRELETGGDHYRASRGGDKSARVYSKWAYIAELDTFFGITNADRGIVLYRLGGAGSRHAEQRSSDVAEMRKPDSAQAPAVPPKRPPSRSSPASVVAGTALTAAASESQHAVPAAPRPTDNGWVVPLEVQASASWQEVCEKAILCDPLGEGEVLYRGAVVETGAPKGGRHWRSISHKMGLPDSRPATPDPEVGGLRFYFPSNSFSGSAGMFKTNFSPDYSFQVGPAGTGAPAQEVFIQFQVRYSCTFIWTDCDPASPRYRTERRCFRSKGKDDGCTASKIALIATGDREGETANACTLIQTAINHGADHFLTGFHRCPRTRGFSEPLERVSGRSNRDSQPNGQYHCPRILSNGSGGRGWNNTADTCFRLIDDRWITIQIRLRFGPWQKKPKKGEPELSHVSIWAAREGENDGRQLLVIDNDFYAMDPGDPRDLVGKIWLMPHLYGKSPEEDHPPFYVWYRNLVVSESLVPNPE